MTKAEAIIKMKYELDQLNHVAGVYGNYMNNSIERKDYKSANLLKADIERVDGKARMVEWAIRIVEKIET